ncbi:bifunctional DNA primase/polymerase [Nocardiopsis sp. N85]|uniref:bifunctional DNA primase/polymerase n=1 Tax=Nocardiopsis sp. N85 TaxID=3029400 RepID=UPI00237F1FA6|nr:bifunctional DNA primase/polymerase [Nocardiopsis sp. N85]MDE3725238.1 bifunctional DNA primase/polymerase [Nocardiopsis sp. N85]
MSTPTSVLPYAMAAVRRGWHVFPLRSGSKKPLRGFTGWERHATREEADVIAHWGAHPTHNVAVATGPSGLVVVDLDTPKDGETPPPEWDRPGITDGVDVFAALAGQHADGEVPWTFAVRTRRGGLHLYYTVPAGITYRNTSGKLGWLIDTRATGGYVVGPGSVVADADGHGPYTVENPAPVAPLPAWLADLLKPAPLPPQRPVRVPVATDRRTAYLRSAVEAELSRITDAPPHHRNNALYTASVALGQLVAGGELTEAQVTGWLSEAAAQVGQTPREIPRTIRSGLRAGANRPRKVAA